VQLYDNSVECVGDNLQAQLGLGNADGGQRLMLVPASVLAGISVKNVGCGYAFNCVLAAAAQGSQVYCFGNNGYGQLGTGTTEQYSATHIAIQGLSRTLNIAQLVAGKVFACVAYTGGDELDTVQCWGGTFPASPLDVSGTAGATALAAGYDHARAILRDKTVVCWDVGSVVASQTPGLNDVVRIVAGDGFSFGILRPAGSLGSLWCWGNDGGLSRLISISEAARQVPGCQATCWMWRLVTSTRVHWLKSAVAAAMFTAGGSMIMQN
jgi:alpha-tubulin suppressor-like RCC1 family protein